MILDDDDEADGINDDEVENVDEDEEFSEEPVVAPTVKKRKAPEKKTSTAAAKKAPAKKTTAAASKAKKTSDWIPSRQSKPSFSQSIGGAPMVIDDDEEEDSRNAFQSIANSLKGSRKRS